MTEDRLARIRLLLGDEGVARLADSFVVVVGLGAVGSYAVEGLARAGVGRLRLVDFDVIKASNINRQLYALDSTLGKSKASVAAARVRDISPGCRIEPLELFADSKSFDAILEGGPDLVIDAIDSIGPKAYLIAEALKRKLRIISSMGAALRTDPGTVRVGPLRGTKGCPLAARLKYWLRKLDASLDFPCVYSTQPVGEFKKARQAPYFGGATENLEEEEVYGPGRQKTALGSLPTITGIFGLTIANTAIRTLTSGE
jgi:tRNA A37 threonylcarbamoyladenosine dehydratase